MRRITWRRVVDVNDRVLREITVGLGGAANGYPRTDGFDIVVASEVMAILCLATTSQDLKERLGKIVIGYTREQKPVLARDLKAHGAMTAMLKDALAPNLVQTLENNPALIHGGPFANIAHGCNSVMATRTALKLADYVVTEAGFGADLGAEKFIDIKCRKAGLRPAAAVLVATVRAIKYHGGLEVADLTRENLGALEKGLVNLERHIDNIRNVYGLPCVISINHRADDTDAEIRLLTERVSRQGVKVILGRHYAEGGKGALELAQEVVRLCEQPNGFSYVYDDGATLWEKMRSHRNPRVPRLGDYRGQQGPRPDQAATGIGLRSLPGVCRQDPVFVLDRPEAARRTFRARGQHQRSTAGRGCRVHRDDLRRHHDHARPAEDAGGQQH